MCSDTVFFNFSVAKKAMDEATPLISVIMPCYNYGHFLPDALESVLAQKYPHLECIVVDDGSTDNTRKIARGYCDRDSRICYVHQQNQGVSAARNTGIRCATGQYILPLDADDKIAPDYARMAVPVLEEGPSVGIVYCEARFFGSVNKRFALPPSAFPDILLVNRIFASAFFRKEDWARCGGYKENMKNGWEDYDFWLSIIELGREIYQIPEELFFYRQGHSSRSKAADSTQAGLYQQIIRNHSDLYAQNMDFLLSAILKYKNDSLGFTDIQRSVLYRYVFRHVFRAEKLLRKIFRD